MSMLPTLYALLDHGTGELASNGVGPIVDLSREAVTQIFPAGTPCLTIKYLPATEAVSKERVRELVEKWRAYIPCGVLQELEGLVGS